MLVLNTLLTLVLLVSSLQVIHPLFFKDKFFNIETIIADTDENSISVSKTESHLNPKELSGSTKYFFSKIFEQENSQEDIMKVIGLPLLDDAINQGNL